MNLRLLFTRNARLGVALLIFTLSGVPVAKADKTLTALLESPTRPTMTQVIQAVGLHPKKNPFQHELGIFSSQFFMILNNFDADVPAFIAQMEYAFPGATWAPLGRDAVLLGDLLDAFYISLGQPNRVSRLNASGPTINNASPPTLLEFLKSAGYSHDRVKSREPFVILDRTSFRQSSQSRRLMRAIYNDYRDRGGDVTDLLRIAGTFALSPAHPFLNRGTAKDILDAFRNFETARSPLALQLDVGRWTDNTPWNESFGPFTYLGQKIEGSIGAPRPVSDRKKVLAEMIWILQNATTPKFHRAVFAAASKLRYAFPSTPEQLADLKKKAARQDKERKTFAENARLEEEKKLQAQRDEYLSDLRSELTREFKKLRIVKNLDTTHNSHLLASALDTLKLSKLYRDQVIQKVDLSPLYMSFIERIGRALVKSTISAEDYRALVVQIFTNVEIDPTFAENFAKLYKQDKTLRFFMKRHTRYFTNSYKNYYDPTGPYPVAIERYKDLMAYIDDAQGCANLFAKVVSPIIPPPDVL